jgi:hypothetical protein
MDDAKFDRLARAFAKNVSRRLTFALIGGASGLLGQHVARGFQLGPATCGEEGAVCTLVSPCCEGLTCVTSAINTNYGICVAGEGGMFSTGTTLISPFSETVVKEVSGLVQPASTTPATDPEADREARVTEIQARKQTRRSERKTRLDSKRATVRTRKDDQQNRQREDNETKDREPNEVVHGPQVQLKLFVRQADADSGVDGEPLVPIEVVRVTNRDDVKVVLTRIEPIKGDLNGVDLITSQFTLGPGESYSFVSGLPSEDAADAGKDKFLWVDKIACDGTIPRQGYRVKAAYSRSEENHEFVVRCNEAHATGVIDTRSAATRRKRKKNGEQKHKRNSQRQKKKKR